MAGDSNVAVTAGSGTAIDTYQVTSGDHRQVFLEGDHGGYQGRFTSYRIPGRAGTTGANLAAIWNASASSLRVSVNFVAVDVQSTAAKVVSSAVVRTMLLTTIPTSGTAGWKVARDSALTSNSNVTLFQDASAEGTSSATALAFTQTAATSSMSQEFTPRALTLVGYESFDRATYHIEHPVTLNANQGLGVRLDYTAATASATTDLYVVTIGWEEYV